MQRCSRLRLALRTALLVAAVSALPALAANMGFAAGSAMSYFTEADMKLFNAAFEDALNKAAAGDKRAWANDKTQSSGEITVVDLFSRDGLSCRTLTVVNKYKGTVDKGQYRLCKEASGKWAIVQ